MTQLKHQISIPLKLTNTKTIQFKPFGVATMLSVGLAWLILVYVALVTGRLSDVFDMIINDYSFERDNWIWIYVLLLAPGALALAYGNALLAKVRSRPLFWIYFIIGGIVMTAVAAYVGVALALLVG